MMFLQCHFKSAVLKKACMMNLLVPQEKPGHAPYRVLYLLHGLSDDHSGWQRRTSVERYVENSNVLVVMPDGGRSFYVDAYNHYGNYWTFLSKELPDLIAGAFPISTAREDTFAMGLSMGGYGALKLALKQPGRFGAVVGLSSVADIVSRAQRGDADIENSFGCELRGLLGSDEQIRQDNNDLFALAEQCVALPTPPRVKLIIGTEDTLLEDNRRFRDHLQNIHYPGFEYAEAPGNHNWAFWDSHFCEGLHFLLGE
ncbi:MAG: esterase family protein [Victivallales bacterium]|nr:esterase family protein [Victivallales bacterium]